MREIRRGKGREDNERKMVIVSELYVWGMLKSLRRWVHKEKIFFFLLLQGSYPVWEDFISKAGKLQAQLRWSFITHTGYSFHFIRAHFVLKYNLIIFRVEILSTIFLISSVCERTMCKCVYVHTQTCISVNAALPCHSVWTVCTLMGQLRRQKAQVSHSASPLSRVRSLLVSAGNVLTSALNITEHRNRVEWVCLNRHPTQMFITTERTVLSKHVQDSL